MISPEANNAAAADQDVAGPPASLGRREIALIALLMLATGLGYVDRQALMAIAPTLQNAFKLSTEEWGWIQGAFSVVYMIGAVLGGLWIDRVGVRWGLLLCFAFWTLASAGHALATGFWSLCFWRILLGAGEGPGFTSLLKGVRRLMPLHLRDTGAGLISASTVAGTMVAGLLVVPLTGWFGSWQIAFAVTSGLGILWLPAWWLLAFRSDVPLGPGTVHLQTGTESQPLPWQSPAVWATFVLIFLSVPATVFTNNFPSLFLSKTYDVPQEAMAYILVPPFLATDIGQILGGVTASWLLRRGWSFQASRTIVMGVGFPLAAVMIAVNAAPTAGWALFWFSSSRFWFMFAYTAMITYGMETVPENQTGFMTGLMNATFSLCNLLFSPLFGRMVDASENYRGVINLIGVSPIVGLILWLYLSRLHVRPPRGS